MKWHLVDAAVETVGGAEVADGAVAAVLALVAAGAVSGDLNYLYSNCDLNCLTDLISVSVLAPLHLYQLP